MDLKKATNISEIKKISISGKRQMTIPKQFYEELQFGDEVICQIIDGALVIKPSPKGMDFSDYILNDLIKEGYEAGEELMEEFKYRKSKINEALLRMVDDAKNDEYQTYSSAEELFESLDKGIEEDE